MLESICLIINTFLLYIIQFSNYTILLKASDERNVDLYYFSSLYK